MDPMTALTIASIGFSLFSGSKANKAQREQMEAQAALERQAAAELNSRVNFNISMLREEGAYASKNVSSSLAGGNIDISSSVGLAHMNKIARAVNREASIMRREADAAIASQNTRAMNLDKFAEQQYKAGQINLLGNALSSGFAAYQNMPRSGSPTPQKKSLLEDV
jgi:hypothetical protein